MAISFLVANGVQAASASLHASTTAEGILVYDDTAKKLKVCDGDNWIEVGSGSGTDTLASLSCTTGQIAKYNGSAWACAADVAGSGVSSAFSVYRSTNQTVSTSTYVKIDMTAEEFDIGNEYDLSTDRFTPTVAGKYILTGTASINPLAAGASVYAVLYKNGGQIKRSLNVQGSNGVENAATVSAVVDANGSTDYFEFYVWSGSATVYGGINTTHFSGGILGGGGSDTLATLSCDPGEVPEWDGSDWICGTGAGGGGSAPISFSAETAVGVTTSTSATKIVFATERHDMGSAYDATTGEFTASDSGYYHFSASLGTSGHSGANYKTIRIASNSATQPTVCLDTANDSTNHVGRTCAGGVYLNAGEKVWTEFNAATGGLTLAGYFSGFKINGGGSGTDTLAGLSCDPGEVPEWDGSDWICGTGSGGALVTGTAAAGTHGAAVTNAGWQNFPGSPTLTLPSAGTYYVTSQNYYAYSAGCGDVIMNWNGSNITYQSSDAKWQACGASGTNNWTTDGHVVVVSAATTLSPQYTWTTAGTSGQVLFNGAKFVKLNSGGGGGGSAEAAGDGGQIQFNNGADAFAADAALHWDNTNKRMGIGTTAPEAPLVTVDTTTVTPRGVVASQYNTGVHSPLFVGKKARGTLGTPEGIVSGDFLVALQGSGHNSTAFGWPQTVIASRAAETWTPTSNATNTGFWTTPSAAIVAQERMRIDQTGAVSIGAAANANASSLLDLTSTTRGFLPPRMTTAQRDAIASPAEGLVVYNTTTKSLDLRLASGWASFGGSMSGNTMVTGWPDAIICSNGSTKVVLYLGYDNFSSDYNYYYHPGGAASYPYLGFTRSTGAYYSNGSLTGYDCINKTIGTLVSESKTFNFVGGLTASADGSAGQLQFNEGGNLKADAALHWDNTNKRLGIGTASPIANLHVRSAAGANTGLVIDQADAAAGNRPVLYFAKNGAARVVMSTDGIGYYADQWNGTATTNRVTISNDGQFWFRGAAGASEERLYIGTTGNVGIGTTAPSEKLHVDGTGIVRMRLSSSNNATQYLQSPSASGAYWDNAGIGLPSFFRTSNSTAMDTTVMSMLANGNVGIGTTSPSNRLHVMSGAANTAGDSLGYAAAQVTGPNWTMNGTSSNGTFLVATNDAAAINVGGSIGFAGRYTGTQQFTAAAIKGAKEDNTAGNFGGYLAFGTRANGTQISEKMRISGNGNVGIGTASPSLPFGSKGLHVYSGAGSHGSVMIDAPSGYSSMFAMAKAGSPVWHFERFHVNDSFNVVQTGVAERMTVLTSGNVGIGVATPSYRLQSAGQVAGAGAYVNTSDARLKTDVHQLDYGLGTVMRLRPVSFQWRTQDEHWKAGRKLGLIAQEVEEIVPEIVSTASDDMRTKSIAYGDLTPVLIKAVHELKAENDSLRVEIKAANDNYEELRREIDALKASR